MIRGDIRWADLGEPRGSAAAVRRPVVIVQGDSFNRSRIRTVIVAVMTSNLALAQVPGNVLIRKRKTGLRTDSVKYKRVPKSACRPLRANGFADAGAVALTASHFILNVSPPQFREA